MANKEKISCWGQKVSNVIVCYRGDLVTVTVKSYSFKKLLLLARKAVFVTYCTMPGGPGGTVVILQ